jgi:hypothetical protein
MDSQLTGSLEENILTLLCWNEQFASSVQAQLESNPGVFSTRAYQEIAAVAFEHLDTYKIPPREHISDLLETQLNAASSRRIFEDTLNSMANLATSIQPEFVLNQLTHFLRIRALQEAVDGAAEALYAGDIEGAEAALAAPSSVVSEGIGTFLHDISKSLAFLRKDDVELFSSAIPVLDQLGAAPRRKSLYLLVASAKRGKSWWMMQVGKEACLGRKKVLHITLEMSEELVAQRYIQGFLSMTDRTASLVRIPEFARDEMGRLLKIDFDSFSREAVKDPSMRAKLESRIGWMHNRTPLLIKEFPTSQLTIRQLGVYLDMLEKRYQFVPDMLIIDYADLMALDAANIRVDTGRVFKELRGLAVQRNLSLITATQGNRETADARLVTSKMVAEVWSKIATADAVITYSQTSEERKIGLARIYLANSRWSVDRVSVLISQSYEIGQFCLDSILMSANTEALFKDFTIGEGNDED